jgi:hypothetical protein
MFAPTVNHSTEYMNDSIATALRNWIPYKLITDGGQDLCRWLYLGDKAFTEPFFDETISACQKLPENSAWLKALSSLDILPNWAANVEAVPPTAIIFHVSRCGSTLVSQLLSQQAGNIVLSEVPLFDALLRQGNKQNTMAQSLPLLQAAVGLYGAKRLPDQRYLFIKTDSWHIQFYRELRQLYPQTPFVLLYRQPDVVLYSQQKNRGMHAVPGVLEPSVFGFGTEVLLQTDLDVYMGKVLAVYFQRFAEVLADDNNTLAVNYHEGILPIVNKIAAFTSMPISATERQGMEERAGFHAKFPDQVFAEPDVQVPPPSCLDTAFYWYHKVEELRLSRVAP